MAGSALVSTPVQFIDSHHHLWIPESDKPDLGYRWLRDIGAPKPFGDPTPIQRNYEWSEFQKETSVHKMLGSVYVQVDGALPNPVAETAWVQSVFDTTGLSHGIIGLVDLAQPTALALLEGHCKYHFFRGVRQIISRLDNHPNLSFAPEHYLNNAQWQSNYALLQEFNLSFDLQLYPEQMHQAAEFIAKYPRIPVIIDHAGSPYDQSRKGLEKWSSGLQALSQLEFVSIKLSGFGMFDKARSSESIKPLIHSILDWFGEERVLFGSNFPVDKLMGSFNETLSIVQECLVSAKPDDIDRIWHKNARKIYRL